MCKVETGYYLNPSRDNCVTDCGVVHYKNYQTKKCEPCNYPCVTCFGGLISECNSCQDGYWLNVHQCTLCHEYCKKCLDGTNTQCSECKPGYFRLGTSCYAQCPDTYFNDAAGGSVCSPCVANCVNCNGGTSKNCTSCNTALHILTDDYQCLPCDVSCAQCKFKVANCLLCSVGYYMQPLSSTCLPTCPSHYYKNTGTRICTICQDSCVECSGPLYNQCTSCDNLYRKLDGTECKLCTDYTGFYSVAPNYLTCLEYCGDGITVSA